MTYLFKLSHDNPLNELVAITPQPHSTDGVIAAQRDMGADGNVFETGHHIVLLWRVAGRAALYQALLAQFDLDDNLRRAVTIYAPDFQRVWHRYNGYALRPVTPNYAIFAHDIRIVVRDLVELSEA